MSYEGLDMKEILPSKYHAFGIKESKTSHITKAAELSPKSFLHSKVDNSKLLYKKK